LRYTILLDPKVARRFERMDSDLRSRIESALEELPGSPESKGERLPPVDYWKIRIGDYRAIYQIDQSNKSVIVVFIGHRSKVYDDFERML
jgi:mRNA interferase RelE/StbE